MISSTKSVNAPSNIETLRLESVDLNNRLRALLKNSDLITADRLHDTTSLLTSRLMLIAKQMAAGDLIDEFKISSSGPNQVSLDLSCKKRLTFIEAAQQWSEKYLGEQLIPSETLEAWRRENRFNGFVNAADGKVSVDANNSHERPTHENWVVANIAYYIATGEELKRPEAGSAEL